jgi:putative membrane protein
MLLSDLIVPLHGDPWLLQPPLWTNWRVDPTVLLGTLGLAAFYIVYTGSWNDKRPDAAQRPVTTRQRVAFVAGCLVLLLALGPPLEDWAGLLISGHMVQHLLLMMLVPPLLLYGTPGWLLEPLRRWKLVDRIGYFLTRAPVSFFLMTVTIVAWHLPSLYDLSLRLEPLHVVQHIMYLGSSILVWWAVLGPLPAWPRATPLVQCLFVFALTLPTAVVGAFLTFGPVGYYPYYTTVPRIWGIDLATDQQVAGLLMWVLGGALNLILLTLIFFQWANQEERQEQRSANTRARPLLPASARDDAPA